MDVRCFWVAGDSETGDNFSVGTGTKGVCEVGIAQGEVRGVVTLWSIGLLHKRLTDIVFYAKLHGVQGAQD